MLQESLQLHHELGDRWRVASLLESLGALAAGRTVMRAVRKTEEYEAEVEGVVS